MTLVDIQKVVPYNALVGQVLSRLRTEKGLSQREMATRLGLKSQSAYSRIENGKTSLTVVDLRRLGQAVEPQTIIERAEKLASALESQGFTIVEDIRDQAQLLRNVGAASGFVGTAIPWLITGGALGAIVGLLWSSFFSEDE